MKTFANPTLFSLSFQLESEMWYTQCIMPAIIHHKYLYLPPLQPTSDTTLTPAFQTKHKSSTIWKRNRKGNRYLIWNENGEMENQGNIPQSIYFIWESGNMDFPLWLPHYDIVFKVKVFVLYYYYFYFILKRKNFPDT